MIPYSLKFPPHIKEFRPAQLEAISHVLESPSRFVAIGAPTGCHADPNAKVISKSGAPVGVAALRVGDQILGPSDVKRVMSLNRGVDFLYRIKPVKGDEFVVNGGHVLSLIRTGDGTSNSHGIINLTVNDYLNRSSTFKHCHKLYRSELGDLPGVKQVIPPYVMGLLLGDGALTHGSIEICKADPELAVDLMSCAAYNGISLLPMFQGGEQTGWSLTKGSMGNQSNALISELSRLELRGKLSVDKFVPDSYLYSDFYSRLELLAGLIDTDGSLSNGCYDFISASPYLSDAVVYLSRSIGLAAYLTVAEKFCQTGASGVYFRVCISGNCDMIPCRIDRKKAQPRNQKKDVLRTGFEVTPAGRGEYWGFTLNGDGRYILDDFTVMHNCGKSGIALALAQLIPGRTVILTANLGLQQQYIDTFESMGLTDVRGRGNYPCWEGGTCEDGARMDCKDKEGCPYLCALKASQASELTETSYAFWLAANERGNGLRAADTLIMDEAGLASEWLSRALDFHLTQSECDQAKMTLGTPREQMDEWQKIAPRLKVSAQANYDRVRAQRQSTTNEMKRQKIAKELKHAESLLDRVSRMDRLDDNWVVTQEDTRDGHAWKFECVWPGRYREKLFRGVQRVVLLSATMRPKTLSLLGIGKQDYDFREWGRQFPLANGPVIWYPTARVNHRMSNEDRSTWLKAHRDIVSMYPDRNGLIQTVSYARAKEIVEYFRSVGLKRDFYLNGAADPMSQTATEVYAKFLKAKPGSVLISPSFSTGWDFKGKAAEYNIISKLAFPDTRSKVMKARCEQDPSYPTYLTAQEFGQGIGRINRSEDDLGTTYLLDDNWAWFSRMAAEHMPRSIKVRREDRLPKPLEKIAA